MVPTEKYTKTNLNLRQDLFLKVKLLASIRDVTVTDIVNDALEKYLSEHEEELKQKLVEIIK